MGVGANVGGGAGNTCGRRKKYNSSEADGEKIRKEFVVRWEAGKDMIANFKLFANMFSLLSLLWRRKSSKPRSQPQFSGSRQEGRQELHSYSGE